MVEIVRTNDVVLLSFVEALLREAGFGYHVADVNMSFSEGSIGVFPRRVLVLEEDGLAVRRLLIDAGLEAELRAAQTGADSYRGSGPGLRPR